jgi:primosomal protein N' (replication factor Y)
MVGRVGAALREAARRHQVTVLGPAPAPLAMLRGRKRFHCLLKGDDWPRLRAVCQAGMAQARREKHIRMSVDFDPVDML